MNAHRVSSAGESCEVARCANFPEFTVEHPTRGTLDVCGYHARQIRDAFDSVEVEL